ncbi:MurR/RpiR family transcriptional regulator [Brevibacterium casei]|uniref:MurR/RpiR family transcriptional regulator n=1 Tax=Brevibacterium casei TaxID=33889 RepID=UPI00223B09DF|nr:MurR/RpiR family transcriptional regulator [Brevibacterium casei]MCT1550054.1 MurR/RpiR family transcriptional regulator [Brevibacterium casei]MCT2208000.1 MurR/RpiR family transcriptional regulator [Brevibacterium casei]
MDRTTSSTSHSISVIERIRAGLLSMSAAERRVAEVVLQAPEHVMGISVTELAKLSGASVGSVVRFCQSIGLKGYQDLKLKLAQQMGARVQPFAAEVSEGDDAQEVVLKILHDAASAFTEAARNIDGQALERMLGKIAAANRIMFAAIGTSAPLAADIAYRFVTLGLPAHFAADSHVQHVTARLLSADDVCFAISHTGSTVETLQVVRAAKAAGATTMAVTSFSSSPLTELCDEVVVAGSHEKAFRVEAMVSRSVHLAVLDALYTSVALREPSARGALEKASDVVTEHRI